MAYKNKTVPTSVSPSRFLDSVENAQRRADGHELMKMMHIGPSLDDEQLMAKLGKHRRGKGCLYINKLDDIDRDVLGKLIAKSVASTRKRIAAK